MAKKDKYSSVKKTLFFWLAFFFIILIVFLFSKDKILLVLGRTDFFNQIFGTTPEWIAEKIDKVMQKNPIEEKEIEKSENVNDESNLVISTTKNSRFENLRKIVEKDESLMAAIEPVQKIIMPTMDDIEEPVQEEAKNQRKNKAEQPTIVTKTDESSVPKEKPSVPQTKLMLCFVIIDSDGAVVRYELERIVAKTVTPLTVAINSLLQGPTIGELEKGYMTLIPSGTKLLGASVSNRVATLNFSDEFMQNKYGVEGYIGQLMQIVFTATAFSSIDSVQFLIEGQRKEYLGGDGVWIGSPLARGTFR
ncbi:MAG: hypothetical protein GX220_06115 [Treponema sp.]|nr:hypothetical protein [Treponema sp.]